MTMTVQHAGERYPIYREAASAFWNAKMLTGFLYRRKKTSEGALRMRVESDTLLRGFKAESGLDSLLPIVNKHQKEAVAAGRTEMQITYSRAMLSGLFYRMYERERAGLAADFSAAAEKAIQEKAAKKAAAGKDVLTNQRILINRTRRENEKDYRRWKRAFGCEEEKASPEDETD